MRRNVSADDGSGLFLSRIATHEAQHAVLEGPEDLFARLSAQRLPYVVGQHEAAVRTDAQPQGPGRASIDVGVITFERPTPLLDAAEVGLAQHVLAARGLRVGYQHV